jgi:hypothetical protein
VIDGPFLPGLEEWNAPILDWNQMIPTFFPSIIRMINCPRSVFGETLESVPKSLTWVDAQELDMEAAVCNLPPSLLHLELGESSLQVLSMLPKTLRYLDITSSQSPYALTMEDCMRLERLDWFLVSLHQLESTSCLSAFKCLTGLIITVKQQHLAHDPLLFEHLSPSCKETIVDVQLTCSFNVKPCCWQLWISQLHYCPRITSIICFIDMMMPDSELLPSHLKYLPPSLTGFLMPANNFITEPLDKAQALLSAPEFHDCFHHFPKSLTQISFGLDPITLSDDCFSHLPPYLAHLDLRNVLGITDKFWKLPLPPLLTELEFHNDVLTPSFCQLRDEHLRKIRILHMALETIEFQ